MNSLALIMAVLITCISVAGQVKDVELAPLISDASTDAVPRTAVFDQKVRSFIPNKFEVQVTLPSVGTQKPEPYNVAPEGPPEPADQSPSLPNSSLIDEPDDTGPLQVDNKFHWKPAFAQSGLFLLIQHSFRMTQPKTTRELGGKFFADWGASVKNLKGWADGNKGFTNYFAHPMQGGLTGRIFINNSGRAKRQEFGRSKEYWTSRLKAMAWTAVWSTQFEIGPISEATIGNVGQWLYPNGKSKMSYVDFVITPTMGTGFAIVEDAVDKYLLKNWIERKTTSKLKIKFLRSILTPNISFANLLRGKPPWYRDFQSN